LPPPRASTAEYVHLGMRYLCVDFADMATGAGMVRKLHGLYDFLSPQANPLLPPRFDKIGKVMGLGGRTRRATHHWGVWLNGAFVPTY
jgi:hypothetical protein